MKRRTVLRGLAGLAAMGSAGTALNRMAGARASATDLSVTVLLDEPIGTIRPAIYSQFAEHIGGVIYDGIWVGPDSKVPNIGGFRKALVEHVKRLGRSSSGGREDASRTLSLARWNRAGRGPSTAVRAVARGDRTETFGTHEFFHLLPALRGRALFRGERGNGVARRVSTMGRILQRTGRIDHACR